ncbi:TetR/AcrR family transcriptional regulator [Sulfurimonas sp.]|uniref:TetR/AcrR family transcriptional regulator n=1 Tax=Sulfurimonas sp. TaxID=2022749 RepID=UPI002601704C|nr:TetR/AcrR family transcriptional regulator [Sulfurimonas sp.]
MAIIVDKVQKKKDIALACKDLFVNNSLKDLTIAKIATNAGISKGSIYDYFQNKEEIVFELLRHMMLEHDEAKECKLKSVTTAKERVKIFAEFFYSDETKELREIYKDFISINLTAPNEHITSFQTECVNRYFNWMCNIIQEGIDKQEIIPKSIDIAKGLFALGEGMFISSSITNTIDDLQKELNQNIETIFSLIEVKK